MKRASPRSYLLPALLAVALGCAGWGLLSWEVFAQQATMQSGSRTAQDDEGADKRSGAATDQETELARLITPRHNVRGMTARGQGIEDAPPFTATEREPEIEYFPCSDCHADQVTNRHVRKLEEEHTDLFFNHGGGRFWCYDVCHNAKKMDTLVSVRGIEISYDEAYKLCGQCHFQRQKDWYFGGHGKRAGTFEQPREVPATHDEIDFSEREKIGTWTGKRTLTNCPACHNPHSPSIKPYKPSPPPQVRRGLARRERSKDEHLTVWQLMAAERGEEKR